MYTNFKIVKKYNEGIIDIIEKNKTQQKLRKLIGEVSVSWIWEN